LCGERSAIKDQPEIAGHHARIFQMRADLLQSMGGRKGIGMYKPERVPRCFESPGMHLYTTSCRCRENSGAFGTSQRPGVIAAAAINDDDLLLALELLKAPER